MRRVLLVVLPVVLAFIVLPSPASAATCSDYSTQADAQRAADTRDADGDGIYCETLPCPCSTGSGGPAPTPKPKPKPYRPGPSVSFHPRTQYKHCQIQGPLPDPACTPGARFKNADRRHICRSGYTKTVRYVSQSL